MIVTCQRCDTSFQLDDARVPADGVRVRCSRCKEAFFLAHPGSTPQEAINETVRTTLVQEEPRPPDTTQDLIEPAGMASGEGSVCETDSEDEPDWEFNIDPPLIEAQPAASPAGVDRSDPVDFGSGAHPLDSGVEIAGEEAIETETVFGSIDDYSSLMMEEEAESVAMSGSSEEELREEQSAWDPLAGRYSVNGVQDPTPAPGSFAEDFLSNSDGETPSESKAFLARLPLTSKQTPDSSQTLGPVSAEFAWGAGSDLEIEAVGGPVPQSMPPAWIWTGRVVGWTMTLVLMAVVLGAGLWPEGSGFGDAGRSLPGAPFQIQEIKPSWLETARGDWLLRIRTRLEGWPPGAAAWEGSLRVTLVDRFGQPVSTPSQALGQPLAEFLLREGTPSELRQEHARNEGPLNAFWARDAGPFEVEAVIQNVPEEAVEAEFEWVPHLRPAWRVPTDDAFEAPGGKAPRRARS
ncbi:MAG: zinc-ribbon domain-containing protein [Myxococcota bacterium]|nr:zinc-ribbon domain-containing protein [Myxococcota bacterium]